MSGCEIAEDQELTYFGGKIKNPKGKYVYISQGKKVLDSARLDGDNKFYFALDSVKIGLYTFNHGPEFQYLYLEPQDSLLIYLNTWDFDESLIFSGKGSAKNNFLINLYLDQEKTEKSFKPNFTLGEEEFDALVQEGIQKQLENYERLIESEGEEPSPFFDKLAKAGIYYPFYFLKEYYPFNYMWHNKLERPPVVSDKFYAYRDKVDLSDVDLLDYSTYTLFVRTHLYHLSYKEMYKDPENKPNIEINFMHLVDRKVEAEQFKNQLLAMSAWRTLSNEKFKEKERKETMDLFYTICSDESMKEEFRFSSMQKSKLKKGDRLPELTLIDTKGEDVDLLAMVKDKNTVIYFWPTQLDRIEILNEKLAKLKKQYPDFLFIGVERNKTDEAWNTFLDEKELSREFQFKIPKDAECYSWFKGDMARTILIKNDGSIENSFLFFNDKYFDVHLKNLKKHQHK